MGMIHMKDKSYMMRLITDEELKTRIMKDWVCPLCHEEGHLAVMNYKTGYCMKRELWVPLSSNSTKIKEEA